MLVFPNTLHLHPITQYLSRNTNATLNLNLSHPTTLNPNLNHRPQPPLHSLYPKPYPISNSHSNSNLTLTIVNPNPSLRLEGSKVGRVEGLRGLRRVRRVRGLRGWRGLRGLKRSRRLRWLRGWGSVGGGGGVCSGTGTADRVTEGRAGQWASHALKKSVPLPFSLFLVFHLFCFWIGQQILVFVKNAKGCHLLLFVTYVVCVCVLYPFVYIYRYIYIDRYK
jgi:hypothetical protein